MGEKARRRSSMGRRPKGDGLGLATNPTVRGTILTKFGTSCHASIPGQRASTGRARRAGLRVARSLWPMRTRTLAGLRPAGDARVLFSDLVLKLDRAGAAHERVLLVTERAVYNLDPGTYRLKRRIDLRVRHAAGAWR